MKSDRPVWTLAKKEDGKIWVCSRLGKSAKYSYAIAYDANGSYAYEVQCGVGLRVSKHLQAGFKDPHTADKAALEWIRLNS